MSKRMLIQFPLKPVNNYGILILFLTIQLISLPEIRSIQSNQKQEQMQQKVLMHPSNVHLFSSSD